MSLDPVALADAHLRAEIRAKTSAQLGRDLEAIWASDQWPRPLRAALAHRLALIAAELRSREHRP